MRRISFFLAAIYCTSASSDPLIDCKFNLVCDRLWIATEGDEGINFRRQDSSVSAENIRIGDTLFSVRPIPIRSKPRGWSNEITLLPSGTRVLVKDLERLPVPGAGTEIWVRVANPETAIGSGPGTPVKALPAAPHKPVSTFSAVAPPVAPVAIPGPLPVVSPCLTPPANDISLPVPLELLPPPPISTPPTATDVSRLISGREMYCDHNGLIVHRYNDPSQPNYGLTDAGDTAQREGLYWLGIWLRDNIPGLPKWDRKRKLTFDDVLALLEPNKDGRFRRHPIYESDDTRFGLSIDQFVPLVAALGVYQKYDAIQRMFDAMPEDSTGKHTFNGQWKTLVGGWDAENCTNIRKRQCNAGDCPLQVDNGDCSQPHDDRPCGDVDNRGCDNPLEKPFCETVKAANNKFARDSCEGQKATQNGIYSAKQSACFSARDAHNAAYHLVQSGCIATEAGNKAACELDKVVTYQSCRLAEKFTGDLITPSASNLIARALNKDPLTNNWVFLVWPAGIIWHGGAVGETELWGDARVRVVKSQDRDDTGDDLNMLVYLVMSKLYFPTTASEDARAYFMHNRHDSYGSYMRDYYAEYGADTSYMKDRMHSEIDNGKFKIDTNAVLGAFRWYNRPSEGANPELARLWDPIIQWLME